MLLLADAERVRKFPVRETAPVRMWQMKALADTNDIAPYMSSSLYKTNTIAKEAEVDRYLIGGSLTIIATIFVLYTACKALAADAKSVAAAGTVSTNSPPVNSAPGSESSSATCSGNTCSPYRSW